MQEKPFAAVFISDLHLNPEEPAISDRFSAFVEWASQNTDAVYILGDFFHAWAGDDGAEEWSQGVAEQLKRLTSQQVKIYYIHGNRDFLLGEKFAKSCGMTILAEPSLIKLGDETVLLAHGDRYCLNDKGHQRFRRITRNPWFAPCFLRLPIKWRRRLVNKVRQKSQENRSKTMREMDVVIEPMLKHMRENQVTVIIHGHTHKVGLSKHEYNESLYSQYVLSDWDDSPQLLCYYKTKRLEFIRID